MFIQKLVGITDKPPNIWLVSKIPEISQKISVQYRIQRLVVPTHGTATQCIITANPCKTNFFRTIIAGNTWKS